MKTKIVLVLSLLLAGCQTKSPVGTPLPDAPPLRGKPANYVDRAPRDAVPAPRETPSIAPSEKSAQQTQVIEALIAQNDALTARLSAAEHEPAPSSVPSSPALTTAAAPIIPPVPAAPTTSSSPATAALPRPAPDLPLLVPNAAGAIDATALAATAAGSLSNPFAVRAATADPAREITLDVQGIVTGAQPCALVNGHVVEPGDTIESLRLARLNADSLVLNGDGFAINLPLGTTKVRLAL